MKFCIWKIAIHRYKNLFFFCNDWEHRDNTPWRNIKQIWHLLGYQKFRIEFCDGAHGRIFFSVGNCTNIRAILRYIGKKAYIPCTKCNCVVLFLDKCISGIGSSGRAGGGERHNISLISFMTCLPPGFPSYSLFIYAAKYISDRPSL